MGPAGPFYPTWFSRGHSHGRIPRRAHVGLECPKWLLHLLRGPLLIHQAKAEAARPVKASVELVQHHFQHFLLVEIPWQTQHPGGRRLYQREPTRRQWVQGLPVHRSVHPRPSWEMPHPEPSCSRSTDLAAHRPLTIN